MDIDFSQVAPSLANNPLAQQLRQPQQKVESQTQDSDSEKVKSSEQEISKVNSTSADKISAGDEIETAVSDVNSFLQSQTRQLNFSIDEKSQRSVVKVTDSDTGDVIRQLPSDEVLKLAARIKDLQSDIGAAVGVLFSNKA
ncbi:flagellar protein FlaG [Neptunicella marina]|uniref:Flagellar protein FlaG n=1 Tax=Neptunicella marina TaxID=2125989 RepID=A0A8J6IT04_9ALTE|nr:flagellar protein FlaG [Neptunicella marina]MBC3765041.1 flagellar protein FlaG [Neptunicella marina]